MKKIFLAIAVLSLCLINIHAENVSPQRAPITIATGNMTIKSLINLIETQTNYLFVYSEDEVDVNSNLNLSKGEKTVMECLNEVFSGKELFYYFENNYIILTDKDPNSLYLMGKVVDYYSEKPLVFASISLGNGVISNVSNGEGIFVLKFPKSNANDSIHIAYLGYETSSYAIQDLIGKEKNILKIKEAAIDIDPAYVRSSDAVTMVKDAFLKIPENYNTQSQQMTGFYREMIKKGSTYVTLSEAAIDILKGSYTNSFSNDQIGIYKGRGSVDRQKIDTIFVKFKGGIFSAFAIDVVKNPFLNINPMDIDHYYDLTFGNQVVIGNRLNYSINFTQKENIDEIMFRGTIYIDSENLAISRVEFNMNVEDKEDAAYIFLTSRPTGFCAEMLYATYMVQYKLYEGKWSFDYSRTELKFNTKWDKKLFSQNYTIFSEVAVMDRSQKKVKIDPTKKVRPSDITMDKVADFRDEDFWKDYNVIEPESGIDNVIQRIIKQLKDR